MPPEMNLLSRVGRIVTFTLGVYAVAKVVDLTIREAWPVGLRRRQPGRDVLDRDDLRGVFVPLVLFAIPRVRSNPRGLFAAATLTVLGVALNRLNVFLVAYRPPFSDRPYFPTFYEMLLTAGLDRDARARLPGDRHDLPGHRRAARRRPTVRGGRESTAARPELRKGETDEPVTPSDSRGGSSSSPRSMRLALRAQRPRPGSRAARAHGDDEARLPASATPASHRPRPRPASRPVPASPWPRAPASTSWRRRRSRWCSTSSPTSTRGSSSITSCTPAWRR